MSETHVGEVPVGSQYQEDYFYSKSRARFCETYFGSIEGIYGTMIAKLAHRERLTLEELFRLFLCAVDWGSKFRTEQADEEMELYLKRIAIFKRQLISRELVEATDDERKAFVFANWDFTIIPSGSPEANSSSAAGRKISSPSASTLRPVQST
ncbi:hypothetical protein OH491_01715 [Termitidicoccus mucosus]|uniref:hypothetical protein n=1 Tax=Termitidicoccus mucosus TaxID=1184151 RepID=UPI0011AB44CF